MSDKTKVRLLYLYQHLVKHTDPEHTLSTPELSRILEEEYGLKIVRNTLNDDLAALHDSGMHIEHYSSTQNKYYYNGHVFSLAELKVLADAIASSKFITKRKSNELIAKLLTLTTAENASNLLRHIYVAGRIKPGNEHGYHIVETVNKAIDTRKKIRFTYTDYDVNKRRYVTNNGAAYTVSPYTLEWDGDYYYLRGFCDERQAMRTFRMDRIARQPRILEETIVKPPKGYSPANYSRCVFRMFDTDQPEQVQLLCHVSVMKYLIDNFGREVNTTPIDEEHFTADVLVCTSTTFYRWVFGFGGKIKILGPESVRDAYREMLQMALQEMQG